MKCEVWSEECEPFNATIVAESVESTVGRVKSRVASRNITRYCGCHLKWHERRRQHRTSRGRTNAESLSPESGNCRSKSVPSTAPAAKNDIPHTTYLTKCYACLAKGHSHDVPRLQRNSTLSPLDAALTMQSSKNMQRDTSKELRLPRKMNIVF